jgi:3-hydroxyisobutyrate dehydrogenase-like beta-hydroxyacid dehydrogenase
MDVSEPIGPFAGKLALLGFGEAAQAFLDGMGERRPDDVTAFDLKVRAFDEAARTGKAAQLTAAGLDVLPSLADALHGATAVLSLVTADQALAAAEAAAISIAPGALYFDGNSVAPQTKRAAADAIEAAGGRYVDTAILSPVHPARTRAPLLLSGPHAQAGAAVLGALGFTNVQALDAPVGGASAVKMIRSIMVKGIEALTAECFSAAERAGVSAQVIASLDASETKKPWAERADYNLDRMLVHGARRAEEMREVAATVEALGLPPRMVRATIDWQQQLGEAGGPAPPQGYAAKIDVAHRRHGQRAKP